MNHNFILVLTLGVSFISCSEKRTSMVQAPINIVDFYLTVPDRVVEKSELIYDNKKSLWLLNNQLYSGYAVEFYQDRSLKEKFGILDGKKQNEAIQWYSDGHLKRLTNYYKGKPNGDKKSWSSDSLHTLLSHFKYVFGQAHGEQTKWYPTGELFKKLSLNMGKEEGIQQAWRKNGKLYVNYEARNGRIFGLKRANLCYELTNERIAYND